MKKKSKIVVWLIGILFGVLIVYLIHFHKQSDELSCTQLNKGLIEDGVKLNEITEEGNYFGVIDGEYYDVPFVLKGTKKNFVLKVSPISKDGRWILQEIILWDSTIRYNRILDTTDFSGVWKQEGNSEIKTVVCFGDSITEFGNYPDIIGQIYGAETVNLGFGNCRMSGSNEKMDPYYYFSMYAIAEAISENDFSKQEYAYMELRQIGDDNTRSYNNLCNLDFDNITTMTIFFGTNDFTANVPLGENNDFSDATFKGSMNYIIKVFQEKYPHIQLNFITPIYRTVIPDNRVIDCDSYENLLGLKLVDYVEAIKEVGNIYNVPVLDLYHTSGINKYTAEYYLADGTHPTDEGYKIIGEKIGSFL